MPLVIVLSLTGLVYLFKPQIEESADRPFRFLVSPSEAKPVAAQIESALAHFDSGAFHSYVLPLSEGDAGRILINDDDQAMRCYVHPASLQLLAKTSNDGHLIDVVKEIHGELMLGPRGSYVVELAACWTIVMILTGLFIWWPRNQSGLAGLVYPRLFSGSRTLLRDVHAVTGVWLSLFVLTLIVTGLPWATFWGSYFKSIRAATGTAVARQDWSVGRERPQSDEHSGHVGHQGASGSSHSPKSPTYDLAQIDRVLETVRPLGLAHPVIITPPKAKGSDVVDSTWSVASMTGNRPLRATLTVDGVTGKVKSREDFADRHLIDRIVGVGIALHEGQLFGWPNQALGALTVLGLIVSSVSAGVIWIKRKRAGRLGASRPSLDASHSWVVVLLVVVLAIAMPLFGVSLALVLLLERLVLRRISLLSQWLGLRPA
jgi:uncharacterized iron-regulated membrane protein